MSIVKKERNLNGVKLRKNNRGTLDETLYPVATPSFLIFHSFSFFLFFSKLYLLARSD